MRSPGGARAEAAGAQLLRQARGFSRRLPRRKWPKRATASPTTRCSSSSIRRFADAAELSPDEVPAAGRRLRRSHLRTHSRTDGHSFSRLATLPGGDRVAAAMAAHPGLIGYEQGATDTDLMRLRPGWIAKGGAEGLICAASPDGLGVALKAEDGAMRALRAGRSLRSSGSGTTSARAPSRTCTAKRWGRSRSDDRTRSSRRGTRLAERGADARGPHGGRRCGRAG